MNPVTDTRTARHVLTLMLLCFGASACHETGEGAPVQGLCEPQGELRVVCGIQAPEDLALTPDGKGILLSEFGGLDGRPGRISILDLASEQRYVLYDADSANDLAYAHNTWGDPVCEQIPGFSPHGIDLAQRPGGRWQLLVVNHAGRESVEMLELGRDAGGNWRLDWRGCALAPAGAQFNDVADTGDGGFAVTQFGTNSSRKTLLGLVFGFRNSVLWRWSLQHGFVQVPNFVGVGFNGVVSDNINKLFVVNDWGDNKLLVYDRIGKRQTAELELPHGDNSNWLHSDLRAESGKLLVVSQRAGLLTMFRCTLRRDANCPAKFSLLELDINTMEKVSVFESSGSYFGGGTAALRVGNLLYIGSFTGNRLLIAPAGYGVE